MSVFSVSLAALVHQTVRHTSGRSHLAQRPGEKERCFLTVDQAVADRDKHLNCFYIVTQGNLQVCTCRSQVAPGLGKCVMCMFFFGGGGRVKGGGGGVRCGCGGRGGGV